MLGGLNSEAQDMICHATTNQDYHTTTEHTKTRHAMPWPVGLLLCSPSEGLLGFGPSALVLRPKSQGKSAWETWDCGWICRHPKTHESKASGILNGLNVSTDHFFLTNHSMLKYSELCVMLHGCLKLSLCLSYGMQAMQHQKGLGSKFCHESCDVGP